MVEKRKIKTDRIVVKVGTSTLIHPNGKINLETIDQLSYVLSGLENDGHEVVLVSSGAIGVGMGVLNINHRPTEIPKQQALSAMGQTFLMTIYKQRFSLYGQRIGQLLLTHDVLDYPQSRENAANSFSTLIKWGVIPIVNENDAVAVDEMDHHTRFGDNDQLSAIVANIVDADLLIMLSDIDGFYNKNPRKYDDAQLIPEINRVDETTYELAGGKGSKFGTGGMTTKLKAAERILKAGKQMVLANGDNPNNIFDIVAGKSVGTFFTNK